MKFHYDEILTLFFYIGLLAGLLLIFSGSFREFRTTIKGKEGSLFQKTEGHVDRILTVLTGDEKKKLSAEMFLIISLLIFLVVTATLIRHGFGFKAIVFGLIFAMMPYGTIRTRLISVRLKSSHEGELLIAEILNQYKINFRNMIEAVDQSISCLGRAPFSKTMLFRMARRLKTYRTLEELRTILDDFVYGIDTDWSKMLANNIYAAMISQVDVTAGLEDLLAECKDITQLLESDKRNNLEAGLIVKLLGPVMYFGLMWAAYEYMGYSVSEIISYQLFSKEGLGMLIAIALAGFISFVFITILENRKYDL